ncbi:GntR family transcriptional regulator [Roseateles chitinivorans]|uniref:GntR family transcriptional regulator n=1 Tax=Roseateles chitinivorans TaxID=2917965 RepID=UPI003D672A57
MGNASTSSIASAAGSADAGLAPTAGVSRYAQLAQDLRQRIVGGEWSAGAAIPSETDLAQRFGVALGTVRQAVAMLAAEGIVQRVHGKGTFVTQGLNGPSLLRFFRFRGPADGPPTAQVRRCQTVRLRAAEAQVLGQSTGDSALRVKRVRLLDGKPVLAEDILLPLDRFAALRDLPPSDWEDLLYPMLARLCGVTVARANDELTFGHLDAATAALLDLPEGAPGIRVDRKAFDLGGQCIELRTTWGDATAFHYSAETR